MKFHDAHCHLPDNYFFKNIETYMKEWTEIGLSHVIAVSTKMSEIKRSIELSKKYNKIIPSIGIHPWKAKKPLSDEIKTQLLNYAETISPLVIGEIGLDHHFIKKEEYYTHQQEIFQFFLQLSEKHNLPINIHLKGAEKEASTILGSYKLNPNNVLIHWYSGELSILQEFRDRGYFFTINPSILTGSTHRRVLQEVEIKQLLTESDGNVKYTINGQRIVGSPAIIPQIITKISEEISIPVDEVSLKLQNNFNSYLNVREM